MNGDTYYTVVTSDLIFCFSTRIFQYFSYLEGDVSFAKYNSRMTGHTQFIKGINPNFIAQVDD